MATSMLDGLKYMIRVRISLSRVGLGVTVSQGGDVISVDQWLSREVLANKSGTRVNRPFPRATCQNDRS